MTIGIKQAPAASSSVTLPGVTEPLAYTTGKHGHSADRTCTTVLVGLHSGLHYCAEPTCGYKHENWASVFAHRSKHTKDKKAQALAPEPVINSEELAGIVTNLADTHKALVRMARSIEEAVTWRDRAIAAEKNLAKLRRAALA